MFLPILKNDNTNNVSSDMNAHNDTFLTLIQTNVPQPVIGILYPSKSLGTFTVIWKWH